MSLLTNTPEWHTHRARHFNASDAPAMLGCSPYTTRAQLLHRLHTGLAPEADAGTQRLFNNGHRFEALARPFAEEIIGDDLAPVIGTEGKLSASFDGLTLMGDTAWEHKTLNAELRGCMKDQGNGYALPKHYRVQMEQQLLVSGAERVLFMASEWTGDGSLVEERHCWYASDPSLRAEIIAGWRQFEVDLAAYVPPAASAVEKIVAEPVQSLPAVSVIVSGEIAIRENFRVFEIALRDFLEHRLIREPKTDQDFADLDLQIKAMKGAEAALDGAEAQMLAQIQTVDQAKKTKDMLAKLVRDNRLMAEKLLASEKERRRGEIVAGGVGAIKAHVEALNKRLGRQYMPPTATAVDFGTAIKGMRSLASMEDAVATALARAKIAANETADRIQANLDFLREGAEQGNADLFPDLGTLALKAADDFRAVVAQRINARKQAQEAERARIRAEEEARATEAAREKNTMALQEIQGIQQQVAIATLGRAGVRKGGSIECIRDTLAETEAWVIDEENFGALTGAAQAAKDRAIAEEEKPVPEPAAAAADHYLPASQAAVAPSPGVAPIRRPAAAPAGPPTLRLGDIKRHMAPLDITAEGLRQLGFEPAGRQGAAVMYRDDELPYILTAAIAHLTKSRDQLAKAA